MSDATVRTSTARIAAVLKGAKRILVYKFSLGNDSKRKEKPFTCLYCRRWLRLNHYSFHFERGIFIFGWRLVWTGKNAGVSVIGVLQYEYAVSRSVRLRLTTCEHGS